jgi:hypothetical protein
MKRRDNELQPSSTWISIYNNLKELYLSTFKWVNLPEGLNQRYLELQLFEFGRIAFFKDEIANRYLALKCNQVGNPDVYGEPINIHSYAESGVYQKDLINHKNGVLIYNNLVRDTPQLRIMDFAKRLYRFERTIDVNVNAQKTPFIILCDKKNELTMKNIYGQISEDFKPAVFVDKDIDLGLIKVLKTDAPIIFDKLQEQKKNLWNEVLSYIGIENNSAEKNERLVKSEVMVSNGLAIANRNAKLYARQTAIDEINGLFGLNILIEVNNLSYLEFENDSGGGELNE